MLRLRTLVLMVPWAAAACTGRPDAIVGIFERPPGPTAIARGPSDAGAIPDASPGAPAPMVDVGPQEAPPDANARFDWPESPPEDATTAPAGDCLPGVYSGEFSCQIDTGGLFPTGPVTGPVTFTLEESAGGEFLDITAGRLEGATGFVLFTADLIGRLDCTTNRFDAQAVNGVFTGGTFSGTLQGILYRSTQTLSGTWSMAPTGGLSCKGLWSVARTP